jgi:hypothetical protein
MRKPEERKRNKRKVRKQAKHFRAISFRLFRHFSFVSYSLFDHGLNARPQSTMRLFRILTVPVIMLTCITISAQTKEFGDISIGVESIALSLDYNSSGYEEFRATLSNRSAQQSHQVILAATGNARSSIVMVRRTIAVAAASTVQVSLFLPQPLNNRLQFEVTIDGQLERELVPVEITRTGAWVRRPYNTLSLLISQRVNRSKLMSEDTVEEGLTDKSGEIYAAYLPYDVPLNEWSANWLGYTQFDGIIITSEELREMPSGVRSALWSYLECGGSLLVIGSWEVPNEWRSHHDSMIGASSSKNYLSVYYVGFGTLILTGSVEPKRIEAKQWSEIMGHWHGSRAGKIDLPERVTPIRINQEFPIVDHLAIPVRGFFVLMILFVIVIGPLNLIWLARRRKKIWLLWTVPAISLLTTLGVSAFSLFSEGLGSTSRTEAITILDEASHRAMSIGWLGFYSPVMPGEGLHFSYDTELGPFLFRDFRQGDGTTRMIDWSNDQHLLSEWISARVPVHFKFRKSEVRRERLTVRRGAQDSISIVNGLGAGIRQLWLADKTGEIYTATNISAGAESRLTPINLKAAGAADKLRQVFTGNWLETINNLEPNPREALAPGCYLAVLDASPFIEEGLHNVKTRKSKTVVYGIQADGQQQP